MFFSFEWKVAGRHEIEADNEADARDMLLEWVVDLIHDDVLDIRIVSVSEDEQGDW